MGEELQVNGLRPGLDSAPACQARDSQGLGQAVMGLGTALRVACQDGTGSAFCVGRVALAAAAATGAVGTVDLDDLNAALLEKVAQPGAVRTGAFHARAVQHAKALRPTQELLITIRIATARVPCRRPTASITTPTCTSRWVSTPRMTSPACGQLFRCSICFSFGRKKLGNAKQCRRTEHSRRRTRLLSGHSRHRLGQAKVSATIWPTGHRKGMTPIPARVRPDAALEVILN